MENRDLITAVENLTDKMDSFLHLMEDKVKTETIAIVQQDQFIKTLGSVEKYLRILVDKYQDQEGIEKIFVTEEK